MYTVLPYVLVGHSMLEYEWGGHPTKSEVDSKLLKTLQPVHSVFADKVTQLTVKTSRPAG